MSTPKNKYPVKGLDRHGRKWRWRRTIDGTPVKVIFDASTEQDAIAQVLEFEKSPHLLVSKKWEREIENHLRSAVAKKSISSYYTNTRRKTLNKLAESSNIERPDQLTESMIQKWVENMKFNNIKDATISSYITHLREFTKWLKANHKIYIDPTENIISPPIDFTPRDSFATSETIRILLDAAKEKHDPELELILLLGFECGMRHGEISAARSEWVNLEQGTISIPSKEKDGSWSRKGRNGRIRGVTIEMVNELQSWFKEHGVPSPYLLKPKKSKGANRYRYEFRFKVMNHFDNNGCPDLTIHDMRRSFGSNRVMAGRSLEQVSNWMGIHPNTAWKHYARFVPNTGEIEHGSAAPKTPPPPEPEKKEKPEPLEEKLTELKMLHKKELIDDDEYKDLKKKLLSSISA